MTSPPPLSPAECLASITRSMHAAMDERSMRGRLTRPLALLILNLIRQVQQLFTELAARIAAGSYVARHSGKPHRSTAADPLDELAGRHKSAPRRAGDAAQLEQTFRHPEMGTTPPPALHQDRIGPAGENPSPATREREGPVAPRREGEGAAACQAPPSPPAPRALGPPLPRPA